MQKEIEIASPIDPKNASGFNVGRYLVKTNKDQILERSKNL